MSQKSIDSIYLDSLQYDEKLESSPFRFFIDRPRLIILMIIIIVAAWSMALKSLSLESNPEVQIGIGVVSTVLPGASPEVMEDLVTKKLEKEISKMQGIDQMNSTSRNSISSITVQFKSNVDIPSAVRDLKDKVDLAKSKLPKDAEDPVVAEFSFSNQPVWTFSLAGPYNEFELYTYATKIQEALEDITTVSEVSISWGNKGEYLVALDPVKLTQYKLSYSQVNSAIASQNLAFPLGTFEIGNAEHTLTIDERYYSLQSLKNIIVARVGETGMVRLSDVAQVTMAPKKQSSRSRLTSLTGGTVSAVTLGVTKKRWGSIVNLVEDGQRAIEQLKTAGTIPSNLQISSIYDASERIRLDLQHLLRDGLITVTIVIAVHFLIIGAIEAFVAGMVVPIVFFLTFVVMSIYGMSLNFLSMFALILSLWLLVDDAIVVVSAINQYKRTGKFTTREAALLVLRDFQVVLIATTLTVVWIFSAMLFMTGIIGKFIFSIPFVITVTLLASLLVALFINPALSVMLDSLDGKKLMEWADGKVISTWKTWKQRSITMKILLAPLAVLSLLFAKIWQGILHGWMKILPYLNRGYIDLEPIEEAYARTLTRYISRKSTAKKLLFRVGGLFILSLLLPITWLLKSEFFPKGESDTVYIDIETEPGTRLDATDVVVKQVEAILQDEKEYVNFSTSIGSSSFISEKGQAPNYATISLNLIKEDYGRKESSKKIAERLREKVAWISEGKVTVQEAVGGPPVGSDFEVRIAGDDFSVMEKIAADVTQILKTIPGAINIETSRKPLPSEIQFQFDEKKLAYYGLTAPQVATFLKNSIDGSEITKIYRGNEEIVVRSQYSEKYRLTLDQIQSLIFTTPQGSSIAIREILTPQLAPSVFSINRFNQERFIKVSASASQGLNSQTLLAAYNEKMKNYTLPPGYAFEFWGANEENAKSVQSLFVSLFFGMFFIIGTLVILFNSYKQSALVLVTIPLSLIGVFVGLTIFFEPLSFPAMIGLVALFGIVVRNGIILFDKINLNIRGGISFKEAIIDAGKTRLEPVALTSLCTILGMLPLGISNPTWTGLAISIAAGLAASTFLTLLVLPTLYYLVFSKKYEIDS